MNNIKTIFVKEIKRFFTEPRMLAALFLPGIIIFIIYSLLGNFMQSSFSTQSNMPQNYEYRIVSTNNYGSDKAPLVFDVFDNYLEVEEKSNSVVYTYVVKSEVSVYKEKVLNNEFDLLIDFSDNFESSVFSQNSTTKANVSIFYNGSNKTSSYLYTLINSLVDTTYTNFTINIENNSFVDGNLSEENFDLKNIMSFIIPLVTVSLLFSTVISICPEAIAGEKERGTLASILLTPIKRSELAIGKISALVVVSLASGIVSFLGLVFSLPNLYGNNMTLTNIISPLSFVLLLLLIISSLIVFVTIGLLVSTFAKSIKEAGSYLTPLMTILMIASIIPFSTDLSNLGFAFIPLLNIVSSMNLIIKESNIDLLIPYFGITVLVNLIFNGVIIFAIGKLFNNEKIILN